MNEITKQGEVWLWHCGRCRWFDGGYPTREEASQALLGHVARCEQRVVRHTHISRTAPDWSLKVNEVPVHPSLGEGAKEALGAAQPPPHMIPVDDTLLDDGPPLQPPGETLEEKAQRLGIRLMDTESLKRAGRYDR